LVIAAPVGLAFGSQEQGGIRLLAVEVLGEAEPVGDEEHRGPPRTGPGRSRSSRSPAIAATIWSRFKSRAKDPRRHPRPATPRRTAIPGLRVKTAPWACLPSRLRRLAGAISHT